MRRSLVLSDEAARHPFLASLPPHVRQSGDLANNLAVARSKNWLTRDDAKSFLMAYFGSLLAVAIFIA